MPSGDRIRFATDLCTFYNPAAWGESGGYDDIGHLFASGRWNERSFWKRILHDVAQAGLDGIEITFPPGDWTSAARAYGSAEAFADDVAASGLAVCAGFLPPNDVETGRRLDFANGDDRAATIELAKRYGAFLATCGAGVMVTALGVRRTRLADPPPVVDLRLAERIAETLNLMGAAAAREGVRLALHPEAFSVLRNSRDADLFMLLTDPSYVGLCPDTAQFTVAGSDPIAITRRHRDRIALTHWKDAVGPAPPDVEIDEHIFQTQIQWFAEVGTGMVDWPSWARTLREIDYTGWAVFELDGAADPVADLTAIRRYVTGALGHLLT